MSRSPLHGRVALVTGGGRGLGRVTVLALLGAGAHVVLTSRDHASLQETIDASEFPDRAAAIVCDIGTEGGCRRLAKEASFAFGPIDVLFNNAALGPATIRAEMARDPLHFWDVSWNTLQEFHAVNSTAAVFLAGLLVPTMIERGWGRIVNDTTSLRMMLLSMGYGGSKASLEAHTSAMAYDLAGTGVTANVLIPGGPAATRMSDGAGLDRSQMLDPEVMAAPSVWLASTASDGINGCRFVAARWDPSLPPREAADRARAEVGWRAGRK